MKNITILFAALIGSVIIFSCDKNPEFTPGLFENLEKIIIESDQFSIRYQDNEEEVKFIVEDLLNTSDNRLDEYPEIDFLSVRVDVNNNNEPDNLLDKSYGISSNNTPCMNQVLNEGSAATGCSEEIGYTYSNFFKTTENSEEEHIVYELIIRKENLFISGDTVGLIFIMNGTDAALAVPSFLSPLFSETIEFAL